MANKELVIKTTVDTSGVDKAMQELRQKMSQTQGLSPNIQGSQLGIGDRLSMAAQNDVQRYNQKMQDDLRREHALRQQQYKQSLDAERDLKKFKESGQDVEKEINQELEKRIKLLKEMKELQEKMNVAAGGGAGGTTPPPAGGGQEGGGGRFGGITSALKSFATIGTLVTAISSLSNVANQIAEMQRNVGMNRGAVSRTAMQMSKEGLTGLGIEPITFAKERQEAFQTVMDEMSTRRGRDILGGGGGLLASMGGGALAGAGAGAAFGGVGAIPGAIVGAIGGALGFTGLNKDFRSAVFNTEDYQTMISREAMDKFSGLEQANRLKNFEKYRAYEFMGENLDTMTGAQRAFGISSPTGVVNFMSGMTGAGITSARGLQTAQSLMGESGMTMGKTPESMQTLARMRDLQAGGLTNATSVFGRLMALGTQTQGQEEFKRVMEGAVRGGINSSEMVEETKRFADLATSLAMQSGTNAGIVAQDLAAGMIGTGARDLQAAQTAYQMYEQESSAFSGIQGALKMSMAYSPEFRKGMGGMGQDSQLMNSFLSMPMSQLTPENPLVQRMIEDSGLSFEELREKKQETTRRGASIRGTTFKQLQDLSQVSLSPEEFQKEAMTKGGAYFEQYTDLVKTLGQERGGAFRSLGFKEQAGLVRKLAAGDIGYEDIETEAKKMAEDIQKRGGESIEARLDKSKAAQEGIQYGSLNKFIGQFMEDAEKMAKGAGEVNEAFILLKEAASQGVVSMGAFSEAMTAMTAFSQSNMTPEDLARFRGVMQNVGQKIQQPTAGKSK